MTLFQKGLPQQNIQKVRQTVIYSNTQPNMAFAKNADGVMPCGGTVDFSLCL